MRFMLVLLLMVAPCFAGDIYSSSGIDQRTIGLYVQNNSPRSNETYNLAGRTQVSATLVNGEKTAVIITIGQSTSNNAINTYAQSQIDNTVLDPAAAYTPTNSTKVQNLSIGNKGAVFLAKDPLLGGDLNLSNYGPRVADKLINAGTYARVIQVPIAIGGSFCADWQPGGGVAGGATQIGSLAYRIGLTARVLAYVGLLNNPNLTAGFVLWQQGEFDSDVPATSQATYTACLNAVIAEFRRVGITWPFLVALCTRPSDATADRNGIRAAQAAVVNNSAGVYAGPDTDTIGTTTADRYDGTHFVAAATGSGHGSDQQAALWQSAILAAPH